MRAPASHAAGRGLQVAASFMMTYGTSYHALKTAPIEGGETLLVLGAAGASAALRSNWANSWARA